MHRHGYKGRKLQLAAGPRKALIRGQVTSLVLHEQITTTVAKAKEVAPYFERLVTKAKKGDLHNRRQVGSFLLTEKATQKMMIELAPAFKDRAGGYTRIVKLGNRLGDNAPMATIMLTEKPERAAEDKLPAKVKKTTAKPKAVTKAATSTIGKDKSSAAGSAKSNSKTTVKRTARKTQAKG